MLGWQLAISFALWIGFAFSLWRGYYRRERPVAPRAWLVARAVSMLLLSVTVLFAGVLQLQRMQGIVEGALTLLGWILATLLGAVFVAMQVDAVDALLLIVFQNETKRGASASDPQEGMKDE